MTRDTALHMLHQYAHVLVMRGPEHHAAVDAVGMPDRWPPDGSERKAMRWLGYMQGVCVALGVFSLDEVKAHSRQGYVTYPEGQS